MNRELQNFQAAIRKRYDVLTAAFDRGDAVAVAKGFFSPSGASIGEGEVTAVGHDQIATLFAPFVGIFRFEVTSLQSSVDRKLGWDFANVRIVPAKPEAGPDAHSFKSLFLWEKCGDDWLCKSQMYVGGAFPAHFGR